MPAVERLEQLEGVNQRGRAHQRKAVAVVKCLSNTTTLSLDICILDLPPMRSLIEPLMSHTINRFSRFRLNSR